MAAKTEKGSEVKDFTTDPVDSDKVLGFKNSDGTRWWSLSRFWNWIKSKTASTITAGDKTPVNSDAVNGALTNRTIVETLSFASWTDIGYGNVHASINLIAYSQRPYILFITLGGNGNKSGVIAFLHPISIYGDDSNIQLVTAPLSPSISGINDYSFQGSVLTLSLSATYTADIKILLL